MEFCCPNPENPVITPTTENLKYRKQLRWLMYAKGVAILAEYLLFFNIFSAFVELIMLLIIY